ncbi:MAG TPA: hypothetical protein VKY89_02615 [Thermoanaerobaculia bacterium]|nr:hypothetical protein [Thermoanaerobaculia bacterium]
MSGRQGQDPAKAAGGAAPDAAPGDLFVVRELAEFEVEWAVVARDPRDPALLLVVPADAHPATGSADVRVPARSSDGPLNLRCAYAVRLPGSFFAADLRSGRLAAPDVSRAERRVDELERGVLRGEPLGQETDRDPDYQDWIADVVAPAAEALTAAARSGAPVRPRGPAPVPPRRRQVPSTVAMALAASLVLAAVGLSWRTVALQREVERLSRPLFDVPAGEVLLGGDTRSMDLNPVLIRAGRGASHLLLTVVLGSDLPAGGTGHLEVQDPGGRPLWRSPLLALTPAAEVHIVLPRNLLPGPIFRLALYRSGSTMPFQLRTLKIANRP